MDTWSATVSSAQSGPRKKPDLSRNPRSSAPPQNFYIYFWSENGEFWCIIAFFIGGILCDLELQESKQETRYRRGKSKGAGSPTLATQPHFKPWPHRTVPYTYSELQNTENFNSITVT